MDIIRPLQTEDPAAQQLMGFSMVRLVVGERFVPSDFSLNTLFFVFTGNAILEAKRRSVSVSQGAMGVLPMGRRFSLTAVSELQVLLFRFVRVAANQAVQTSAMPDFQPTTFLSDDLLSPSPLLARQLDLFCLYIQHQICTPSLCACKQQEVFLLLKATMPADDYRLLQKMLSAYRHSFKSQVIALADKYDSVADLAFRMNMDRTHFFRLFKREFGESPSSWLLKHKAIRIREYLETHPDMPLKVVAEELGFPTISTLEDFCSQRLGGTAHAIQHAKSSD